MRDLHGGARKKKSTGQTPTWPISTLWAASSPCSTRHEHEKGAHTASCLVFVFGLWMWMKLTVVCYLFIFKSTRKVTCACAYSALFFCGIAITFRLPIAQTQTLAQNPVGDTQPADCPFYLPVVVLNPSSQAPCPCFCQLRVPSHSLLCPYNARRLIC